MTSSLNFTLAQLEAFACVCECATLTKAARRLHKDRTTLSEQIEYLELSLGYPLFDRQTRPLTLTPAGQQLYRQARLFLHEAHNFNQRAIRIPAQLTTRRVLCYDPFTPRQLLTRLVLAYAGQGGQLDLIACERSEAERLLAAGEADMALCPAVNRAINSELQWQALGTLTMAVFARHGFFASSPVLLRHLAASRQLLPFIHTDDDRLRRLQIADDIQRVTGLEMLRVLLEAGQGWAFLPTHLNPQGWENIGRYATEMGVNGLTQPLVALWRPGQLEEPVQQQLLESCHRAWQEGD